MNGKRESLILKNTRAEETKNSWTPPGQLVNGHAWSLCSELCSFLAFEHTFNHKIFSNAN